MKTCSRDLPYLEKLREVSFDPIFLMGFHRSGTTLLYHVLNQTGEFSCITSYHMLRYEELLANHIEGNAEDAKRALNELFIQKHVTDRKFDSHRVHANFTEEYCFLLENRTGHQRIDSHSLPLFLEMCKKVHLISDGGRPILLKNPWDFDNFLYIKKVLPTARFIFIHRHPFFVINSQLHAIRYLFKEKSTYHAMIHNRYARAKKIPLALWAGSKINSPRLPYLVKRVISTIVSGANYYVKNIHALPESDYISTRYEDICEDTVGSIKRILSFLGLELRGEIHKDELISPRAVQLLPEIERRRRQIYSDIYQYFIQWNYSMDV